MRYMSYVPAVSTTRDESMQRTTVFRRQQAQHADQKQVINNESMEINN